jgi:membrane protein DedA with SNARE-associated domain
LEQSLLGWIAHYGNIALFGLLVLGIVGAPVPDETLLLFAGVLAGRGSLAPVGTYAAAIGGAVSGITVSYLLGRGAGMTVVHRYGHYLHIETENLDHARASFHRIGKWLLMFGYFIPGVRHFTALMAGAVALEPATFAGFAYTGACLWSVSFVSLGWYLGDRWASVAAALTYHGRMAAAVVAILAAAVWLVRRAWVRRRR